MRPGGSARPMATSAARTRSRLSPTALSGRPTTVKLGKPGTPELHLGIHLQAVDALEGHRLDPCHHELRIPSPGSARAS